MRRLGYALNALGALALLASFAARSVSTWWILPVASLPVLVLALALACRPRLRLEASGLHGLILCLTLCAVSLVGFALGAPLLDASTTAWLSALAGALLFSACGRRIDGPSPALATVFLACVGAAYGYGASLAVNELFDGAPPERAELVVNDKWIRRESRGSEQPSLQLAFPDGSEHVLDVEVSRAVYERCEKGERIPVHIHAGALAMGWLTVEGDCTEVHPHGVTVD